MRLRYSEPPTCAAGHQGLPEVQRHTKVHGVQLRAPMLSAQSLHSVPCLHDPRQGRENSSSRAVAEGCTCNILGVSTEGSTIKPLLSVPGSRVILWGVQGVRASSCGMYLWFFAVVLFLFAPAFVRQDVPLVYLHDLFCGLGQQLRLLAAETR
jgi:hypothetical protein